MKATFICNIGTMLATLLIMHVWRSNIFVAMQRAPTTIERDRETRIKGERAEKIIGGSWRVSYINEQSHPPTNPHKEDSPALTPARCASMHVTRNKVIYVGRDMRAARMQNTVNPPYDIVRTVWERERESTSRYQSAFQAISIYPAHETVSIRTWSRDSYSSTNSDTIAIVLHYLLLSLYDNSMTGDVQSFHIF